MAAKANELRAMQAHMISGLPEPASAEAKDWLREVVAQMQAEDPRPDFDLDGLGQRLADIEGRLAESETLRRHHESAFGAARLDALARDMKAIQGRLDAIEARLKAVEARPDGVDTTVMLDPLNPLTWKDVAAAKAALVTLVTREAARRTGHSTELYERMIHLEDLGARRSNDQANELEQHVGWAATRQAVEACRQAHLAAIDALPDLPACIDYMDRIGQGWPEGGAP